MALKHYGKTLDIRWEKQKVNEIIEKMKKKKTFIHVNQHV